MCPNRRGGALFELNLFNLPAHRLLTLQLWNGFVGRQGKGLSHRGNSMREKHYGLVSNP